MDLDVFGDWVDIVFVWSADLLIFFAREGGRMARRPSLRALSGLTGLLRSIFGICIWFFLPALIIVLSKMPVWIFPVDKTLVVAFARAPGPLAQGPMSLQPRVREYFRLIRFFVQRWE